MRRSLLIFVLLFALLLVNAYSKVIYVNSTNCSTQFKKILPGDTIVFLNGSYSNATCGPIYGYNLTFELFNNSTVVNWTGPFVIIPNNSSITTMYYYFFPYNLSVNINTGITSGFLSGHNFWSTNLTITILDNVSANVYLEMSNSSLETFNGSPIITSYYYGGIYAPNLTIHIFKFNNSVVSGIILRNITCKNLIINGGIAQYLPPYTQRKESLYLTFPQFWYQSYINFNITGNFYINNTAINMNSGSLTAYNMYTNYSSLYLNNFSVNNISFNNNSIVEFIFLNGTSKFNYMFCNSSLILFNPIFYTQSYFVLKGGYLIANNSIISSVNGTTTYLITNLSNETGILNKERIFTNLTANNSIIQGLNISGNVLLYNDKLKNITYTFENLSSTTFSLVNETYYSIFRFYNSNVTFINTTTIDNNTNLILFKGNCTFTVINSTLSPYNITGTNTAIKFINSKINASYINIISSDQYFNISGIYNSTVEVYGTSGVIYVKTINNSIINNISLAINNIYNSKIYSNWCIAENINNSTFYATKNPSYIRTDIGTLFLNISNSVFYGNFIVFECNLSGTLNIYNTKLYGNDIISATYINLLDVLFENSTILNFVNGLYTTDVSIINSKAYNLVLGYIGNVYTKTYITSLNINNLTVNNITVYGSRLELKANINKLFANVFYFPNRSYNLTISNSIINQTPSRIETGTKIVIYNLTFNYTLPLWSHNITIDKLIINKTYSSLSIIEPNFSELNIKNSDIWTGTEFTNDSNISISGTKLEFAIVGDKNKINLTNDYMYNSYINATSVSHIKMIGTNFTGTIQCPTVYLNASGSNISGTFNVGLFNEFNIYNSNVSTSSYINITNATYLNQFIEYSNITSKLINTSANLYINNSSIHNDILSSATLYIYNSNTNNINTSKIKANNSKLLNITAVKLADIRYGSFINLNVVNPWYTTLIHDTFNNLIGNTHVFTLSYDNANLVNLTIDHGLIEIKYSDVNDTYLNVTNATEDVENSTIKVFNETIKRTPSTTSLISTVSNYYKFITDTINNLYVNFTLNEIPINYTLNSYVIFNTSKLGKTYIKINQQGYFKNITFNVFISGNTITSPTSNVYILIPGNATNTYLEGNTINTTLFTLKTDSLNSSFIGKVLLINDNITETNEPLVPIKLRYNYGIYYVFVNGEPIKFGTISNTTAKEVIAWVNNSCGYLYNDTIGTVYGCANISDSNITLIETPENNISIKNSEFAEIMAKNSSVTIVNSKVYYHYFNNAPILYNNVSIVAYYLNVNGLDCEINKTCILFADSNGTIENSKLCPTQGFSFAIVNTSQNFNVYNSYFDSVALIPDYNVYNITIISPSDFAKYILDYPDSDMWCNGTPMYQVVTKKVNKSKNMTVVYLKKPKFIVIEKRGKNKIPIVLITLGIILILAKILVKILF